MCNVCRLLKTFYQVSDDNTRKELQDAIDAVCTWAETCQLSLALHKCSVLHLENYNKTETVGLILAGNTNMFSLSVNPSDFYRKKKDRT